MRLHLSADPHKERMRKQSATIPQAPICWPQERLKRSPRPSPRPIFFLAWFFLFAPALTTAQEVPRAQVFAGYSYLYLDAKPLGLPDSKNLNGYNFSPAFNITHRFGVVGEVSGQYNSVVNFRDLAFGGQFLFPWREKELFFAHAMFFDARSFISLGAGAGNTSRAIIGGAGMDYPLSRRFSWRVLQVDYVRSMLFHNNQNNVRLSTGIVYQWRSIHYARHKKDSGKASP